MQPSASCPALCRASTSFQICELEIVDGRDIVERSDAVLRTAMPGHDESHVRAISLNRPRHAAARAPRRLGRSKPDQRALNVVAAPGLKELCGLFVLHSFGNGGEFEPFAEINERA